MSVKSKLRINTKSINIAAIHDAARRNSGVIAAMERRYNRDIAPAIVSKVRQHYSNLFGQVSRPMRQGTGNLVAVRAPNDSATIAPGWAPLAASTVKRKGHNRFWLDSGALGEDIHALSYGAASVRIGRSGVERNRSRRTAKTGLTPVYMSTTVLLPDTGNDIVDSLIIGGFRNGVFADDDDVYDKIDFGGGIRGWRLTTYEYMALNEFKRPYIRDMSELLGEFLRSDLEDGRWW